MDGSSEAKIRGYARGMDNMQATAAGVTAPASHSQDLDERTDLENYQMCVTILGARLKFHV